MEISFNCRVHPLITRLGMNDAGISKKMSYIIFVLGYDYINADYTSSSITCHDAANIIWHMIHTCLDHLVKVVFVRNLASYENSVIWKDELYFTNQRMIY